MFVFPAARHAESTAALPAERGGRFQAVPIGGRESRNRLLQDLNKGTLKTTRPSGLARLAVAFGQGNQKETTFLETNLTYLGEL